MAKKGAMKRDPKVSIQPVKTGKEQAMGRTPREKPMERLSPGVYRGAQGGLVTQAGRPMQREPQAPMAPQVANQQFGNMPQYNDLMYRMSPEESATFLDRLGANPWTPQMPQPSANQGGQYRLSPGMYGTREQAMQQYNQQLAQMRQPAGQQFGAATGQMPPIDYSGMVFQRNRG